MKTPKSRAGIAGLTVVTPTRVGEISRIFMFFFLLLLLAGTSQAAGLKQLTGHVPAALSTAPLVGDMPATEKIQLALGLPLRDEAGLKTFIQQLYDPQSPNYHRFLT